MNLKSIRLELARNPGQPYGDADHAYVFRAPLDAEGYFDRFKWAAVKELCTVKRYENEPNGLPVIKIGGRNYNKPSSARAWLEAREKRANPRRLARGLRGNGAEART